VWELLSKMVPRAWFPIINWYLFNLMGAVISATPDYSGCNSTLLDDQKSKTGVFLYPDGCTPGSNCTLYARWAGMKTDVYCMEIASHDGDYVALGLSATGSMSPAPVIACSKDGKNSFTSVYWNDKTYNSAPAFNSSLVLYSTVQYVNCKTICHVAIASNFTIQPTNTSTPMVYNLNSKSVHLLLASGPVLNGTIKEHTNKTSSKVATNFSKNNKYIADNMNSKFYENCQNTSEYGCFVSPTGCEKTTNCTLGATWKASALDIYDFQLISSSGDFVAVGFSNVSTMGPAPVVACSQHFSKAAIYFNNKDYDSAAAYNHSDFVLSYKAEAGDNSSLLCSFSMNSTFSVAESNKSGEQKFDLNANQIYIVLALGPVKDGAFTYHKTAKASKDITDLTKHNNFLPDDASKTFYKNCKNTPDYGCFVYPTDCEKTSNCTLGANWIAESEKVYSIQLISSGGDYVAMGFPYVSGMSPAPVISCSHDFSKASINWNKGYESAPAFNSSNFISSYKVETGTSKDLICSLTISSQFAVVSTNSSNPVEFDLNENSTHIILAQGPVANNIIQEHSKKKGSPSIVDMTLNNKYFSKNNTDHNNTEAAIYEDCFQTKGCFGYPSKCELQKNCDIIVTYSKLSDRAEKGYRFQIGGKAANNYVAAALSDDNKMGEDSVMACVKDPSTGKLDVNMYWNVGHSASNELADPHFGLSGITGSLVDDFFTCTFDRKAVTNIPIPSLRDGSSNKTFYDLDNIEYYLLLAYGPVGSSSGKILQHSEAIASANTVDLSSFSSVGTAKATLVKLHAAFMILAWLLCANFGTFFARYCKDIFQNHKIFGADVWFRAHQASMGLTVILSLAGLVPILIDKKLLPIADKKYHPLVGLATLVVAFVQPFIGYFRPSKDHQFRPLFKLFHTFLGYSCILMAIASIFLTNELPKKYLPDWGNYLMIAFSVWLGVSHLAMSSYRLVKEGEAQTTLADDPVVRTGFLLFIIGILGLSVAVIMSVLLI